MSNQYDGICSHIHLGKCSFDDFFRCKICGVETETEEQMLEHVAIHDEKTQ